MPNLAHAAEVQELIFGLVASEIGASLREE
jgi:hypothetical protein